MDDDEYNEMEDDQDDNDDFPYDDEFEKDKGDATDIGDEREARWRHEEEEESRFDHYELMCDAAALSGQDVVDPNNPSASMEVLPLSEQGKGVISDQGKGHVGSSSGKGRGATKGLRVSEPMYLEFDYLGRPRGKWRLKYGQQAGFCMRKLNICWNWKNVSEGKQLLFWQDTMVKIYNCIVQ